MVLVGLRWKTAEKTLQATAATTTGMKKVDMIYLRVPDVNEWSSNSGIKNQNRKKTGHPDVHVKIHGC